MTEVVGLNGATQRERKRKIGNAMLCCAVYVDEMWDEHVCMYARTIIYIIGGAGARS